MKREHLHFTQLYCIVSKLQLFIYSHYNHNQNQNLLNTVEDSSATSAPQSPSVSWCMVKDHGLLLDHYIAMVTIDQDSLISKVQVRHYSFTLKLWVRICLGGESSNVWSFKTTQGGTICRPETTGFLRSKLWSFKTTGFSSTDPDQTQFFISENMSCFFGGWLRSRSGSWDSSNVWVAHCGHVVW